MRRIVTRVDALQSKIASKHWTLDLIISTMKTYGVGLKHLVRDVRAVRSNPIDQTYLEAARRHRMISDLRLGIPCVLVYLTPFVGNLLPVVGHFFPMILPSSWRSLRQQANAMVEFQKRKLAAQYWITDRALPLDDFDRAVGFRRSLRWLPQPLKSRIAAKFRRRLESENAFLKEEHIESLSERQLQDALYARGEECIPWGGENVESIPYFVAENGQNIPIGTPDKQALITALQRRI